MSNTPGSRLPNQSTDLFILLSDEQAERVTQKTPAPTPTPTETPKT